MEFDYGLEPGILNDVCFMLFDFNEAGRPGDWEKDAHQRKVPRTATGALAEEVWFAQDAQRVLISDPLERSALALRVRLISERRYRPSQLFLWDPVRAVERRVAQAGEDDLGPFFDLNLAADEQSFFHFKFIRRVDGEFTGFEPDFANRLWSAEDGPEIWTHGDAAEIASASRRRRSFWCTFSRSFRNEHSFTTGKTTPTSARMSKAISMHLAGPPTRQPSTRAWVTDLQFRNPGSESGMGESRSHSQSKYSARLRDLDAGR